MRQGASISSLRGCLLWGTDVDSEREPFFEPREPRPETALGFFPISVVGDFAT